jgi:hypothetical protein
MLAIVDDEQDVARRQVSDELRTGAERGLARDAERLEDGEVDESGVGHRGEVDEPDAVGMHTEVLARELDGDARLPDTAGAGDGEEPRLRCEL